MDYYRRNNHIGYSSNPFKIKIIAIYLFAMKKRIDDCIFPSVDDLSDGCGVLVGNLFITAGHVVVEHPFCLSIEGKLIALDKEDAIIYKYNLQEKGADIAIFTLKDYCSPLQLDNYKPAKGDVLESVSYEHIVESSSGLSNAFNSPSRDWYEKHSCNAIVEEVAGNFFQCNTSIVLKPGSSGSPVLKDGKVCGFLSCGEFGTNKCVFQSSSSVLKMLKDNNII